MGVLNSLKSVGKSEAADSARLDLPALDGFEGIPEAKEQANVTRARLSENEIEFQRIRDALSRGAQGIAESVWVHDRAEAFLRGEPISTEPKYRREDLEHNRDEHQVFAEAHEIATTSLREKVGNASVQVCRQFSAEHQRRVKKIAAAAIALAEANKEEAELRQQIMAAGYVLTAPIDGFPSLRNALGRPDDPNSALGSFLKALRTKGIEI